MAVEYTGALEKHFPTELTLLRKIFSFQEVTTKLPRLEEIFAYTEEKWQSYVKLLPERRVNYLMIAESPPWSSNWPPQYVLDPASKSRQIMKALRRAFSLDADNSVALEQLAERGFLLVDTLPFAMPFESRLRDRRPYYELVRLCAASYLQIKLAHSSVEFSDRLRIAFAYKLPALAFLRASSFLDIGDKHFPLSQELIAVNDSNSPGWRELHHIYNLS